MAPISGLKRASERAVTPSVKDKSFFEILEARIRAEIETDLREEILREIGPDFEPGSRPAPPRQKPVAADPTGFFMTELLSRAGRHSFQNPHRARQAYPHRASASPKAEQGPAPQESNEPRRSAASAEESLALSVLSRFSGCSIPEEFTLKDVRTTFRKAALKTHPDRFHRATEVEQKLAHQRFQDLTSAFRLLEGLFDKVEV